MGIQANSLRMYLSMSHHPDCCYLTHLIVGATIVLSYAKTLNVALACSLESK